MQAPSKKLRDEIAAELENVMAMGATRFVDSDSEDVLDKVLKRIDDAMGDYLQDSVSHQSAEDSLAAIEAWASLASWAVGRVYAPASPWPRGSAGWAEKAPKRLREIAAKLRAPLDRTASRIGADSFSVSVGFPWGIAIALSWPAGGR